MLRELIEHATQREFVYRHEWRAGDLVIWDNRATMHRGRSFDETRVRDLRRVTTRDVASTLDQAAQIIQGGSAMAKIPKILHEHIDTAFPANVCLLGSVLPNGFAQVTPRGGTMVYDDEHIGLWERGTGSSADAMKDGSKLTIYFRKPSLREDGTLPRGGIAGSTGRRKSIAQGRSTKRCGGGWCSPKRTATRTKKATRC